MDLGLDLSDDARADLASGWLDTRLARALHALGIWFRLTIPVIKTGHPLGPLSPSGVRNSHFLYRAADITRVNGLSLVGHEHSAPWLELGQALRQLPDAFRPERIYGPTTWHRALRFEPGFGFASDPFHDAIHADHVHIGYVSEAPRSE